MIEYAAILYPGPSRHFGDDVAALEAVAGRETELQVELDSVPERRLEDNYAVRAAPCTIASPIDFASTQGDPAHDRSQTFCCHCARASTSPSTATAPASLSALATSSMSWPVVNTSSMTRTR